jgi:ATP-dependent RNA helicase DDX10/DBP4
MKKPKSKNSRIQKRLSEVNEIELLQKWIEFGKPDKGSNPLAIQPSPPKTRIGRIDENSFSQYAGCLKFEQLPLSQKTKDALRQSKFIDMTEIQGASLPHSLCGRDILGAAKTGSGKTLAFIIPVIEKLYKERWGPEDGVGSIIISPTRELAHQLFEVLQRVGKHHGFSAGLLIGGRKDIETEKERVNFLNILVCTPGRLLDHMSTTPNFDCSQLQVLVLDEADRILDQGFEKEMNAIISQLPKYRQTLLFSATQTKSVRDLARLSLKDPEYLNVHEDAVKATPSRLVETVMIVDLDKKLDMLWSFIKSHLNSTILVFLSTRKQVKFVYEAFKKLRPGIPLKCMHGKQSIERRMAEYSQFCGQRAVLFGTNLLSRGLDFDNSVDWVVQVDCPDDYTAYVHRAGRTARFQSDGRSVLFLAPSEMKIIDKFKETKVDVRFIKANTKRLQPVSGMLAALLVKSTELQSLAQRAFITYLRSIHKQPDKDVFDVTKLPIDEFAASLGLPMTPKVRFLNLRTKEKNVVQKELSNLFLTESSFKVDLLKVSDVAKIEEEDNDILIPKENSNPQEGRSIGAKDYIPISRVSKKKKLKINAHRPMGNRLVYDDDGNALPPFATVADMSDNVYPQLDTDKVKRRFEELRENLKKHDKEDKLQDKKRRKDKRLKEKMKLKTRRDEDDDDDDEFGSDTANGEKFSKKGSKVYFDSDEDDDNNERKKKKRTNEQIAVNTDAISLAEQEELALKLLNSMN